MEFHQIRYFLAACNQMSFTRAAEACSVSQPALTVAIRKLEEELGGPLFYREGRSLSLTELGRAMRTHLSRIEETRAAAKQAAQSLVAQEMAMIDLGVMCTVGPGILGGAVAAWSERHRNVELVLHDVWGAKAQELLLTGAIDAALIGRRAPLPARFETWPLFCEPLVAAMAVSHPLAQAERLTIEMLEGQSYVDRLRCEFRQEFFDLVAGQGLAVEVAMRSEREDWIQAAIAEGRGVTIMPKQNVTQEGVTVRPIADLPIKRTVEIAAVRGRVRGEALEQFIADMVAMEWGEPEKC